MTVWASKDPHMTLELPPSAATVETGHHFMTIVKQLNGTAASSQVQTVRYVDHSYFF